MLHRNIKFKEQQEDGRNDSSRASRSPVRKWSLSQNHFCGAYLGVISAVFMSSLRKLAWNMSSRLLDSNAMGFSDSSLKSAFLRPVESNGYLLPKRLTRACYLQSET